MDLQELERKSGNLPISDHRRPRLHVCSIDTGKISMTNGMLTVFYPPLHQVVVVDVRELGRKSGNLHRKLVVERALRTKDQDNERFYKNLRARMERCAC